MTDRRMADARMDSMEKDIREIRSDQKELQKGVGEIREKIFNGFSTSIAESHANSIKIKEAVDKLDDTVMEMHQIVFQTDEQRLANCPFKKEMAIMMEKKIKLWLGFGMFFLTALQFKDDIISLIKGIM